MTLCPTASLALEAARLRLSHGLTACAAVGELEEKMLEGFNSLDTAGAERFLELSASLTEQQQLADEVLAREALREEVALKTNYLVRLQYNEKQASPVPLALAGAAAPAPRTYAPTCPSAAHAARWPCVRGSSPMR